MRPTTPTGQLLALSATAVLSVALLAGCGDDNTDPGALPSDSSTSTATSPPTSEPADPIETTTNPATPKDEAAGEAEQVVRDYYGFLDEVIADEDVDLDRLDAFLQDPELADRTDLQERFRDQGFYSTGGSTTFEWIKPTKVKLNLQRGQAAVSMKVCLNLDDVDVRFESGRKVNTLSPALAQFEVFNYDYPNPTGWKIAVADYPGKRCKL